jgi:hypothetical protein
MYLQNNYKDYNEHIITNLQKSKTKTSWMHNITYKSRKQKHENTQKLLII